MGSMHQHHRLITSPVETEVGSILLAGLHLFGHGVNQTGKLRVFDGAALVLFTRGEGTYKDARGKRTPLKRGDAILVFPGVPHWYGPKPGQVWDEIYVAFDGPLFAPWFTSGLLNPDNPIRSLDNQINDRSSWLLLWIEHFATLKSKAKQIQAMTSLVQFLSEIVLGEGNVQKPVDDWLARAKGLLGHDLKGDISLVQVASELGSSYEAFRKRFQNQAGMAPMRYRTERKIESAKQMIRYSPTVTNREICDALGFSDEFHFSKRFRQIAGVTPNDFRKSVK
ncbi:MAG: AraC family transcriptional regulator [Armatimonadota bacterium]